MKRYLLLISMLAAFVAESAAREVYRLNDDWTFYFRSENSADDARNITLPHTWNLDALAGNSEYQRTTGNYMRRLYIPADWASKRLFLRFDGVQTVADVFVNGYHVGEHRGGFTAFTFEITGRVKFGAENRLLVVVSNTFQNDVLPTSTEQNVYGGIYRDVDLILTDRVAVSPTVWGTDGLFVEQVSVDDDAGRGPCGGLCLRAEGLPGDDYPHGARSRRLCGGREDAKEQPDGRRAGDDSLHRRRAAAVEPRRAEPLYGDGARRVRLAIGRGDRAHRVPADRRFGPRPACQRRHGTSARRGALPRSGERRQRLHGGRLRRGSGLRTRCGGQCRPLGFGTARPVPLRPARRAGAHGVDRSAAHAFALSGRRLLLPDGAFPRQRPPSSCARSSPRTSTTPRW